MTTQMFNPPHPREINLINRTLVKRSMIFGKHNKLRAL